jgi:PKD repeat protein
MVLLLFCAGAQAVSADEVYVWNGKWGDMGSENGQFLQPAGVAADAAGYVYLADQSNHRVQKFTSAGTYTTKWGGEGTGDGTFRYPTDVAVSGTGDVYVADYNNQRVQQFTSTGGYVRQWGSQGSMDGQFQNPTGIAVDGAGNVWVADSMNYRVQKFSSTGIFLAKWGYQGSIDGAFQTPGDVAVDAAGYVYVADSGNHRVQKFTSTGTFLAKWGRNGGDGSSGTGDGEFAVPRFIAVDAAGNVYVTDRDNDRVQKFTPGGDYVTQWGYTGTGSGEFDLPGGIAVDPAGVVFVADTLNNRIQRFRRGLVAGFTASPQAGPAPLAVQFTDTTRGGPTSWSWDFGDGATSTEQDPRHVYQQSGRYPAMLRVSSSQFPNTWATGHWIVVHAVVDGLVRVEAEDYDEGGEGVAYHDTTAGNAPDYYRTDDVDIGWMGSGYVVTDTADGEWTRYTVYGPKQVDFMVPITLRVRASDRGRSIGVQVNNVTVNRIDIPGSGAFTDVRFTKGVLRPGPNEIAIWHYKTISSTATLDFDYFTLDMDGNVVTVPGGVGRPTDADGDARYADVNGNGRTDFADVVLYFNQMSWIAANEPVGCFDYNGNGRIDFADVVWLFNSL